MFLKIKLFLIFVSVIAVTSTWQREAIDTIDSSNSESQHNDCPALFMSGIVNYLIN